MALKYIAYGSNLSIERITERVGKVNLVGVNEIEGWDLSFNKLGKDGSGKCTLIRSCSGSAFGAIYEISENQKLTLDEYENGYDTIRLSLPEFGECITYIARPVEIADNLLPFDWYKYLVLVGAKQHGFPKQYIKKLDKIKAKPDTDSDRVRRIQEIFK